MIFQTERQSIFSPQTLSQAGSATTFMVGFLVLVGWIRDIPTLKSVLPGLATMKANTALAFLLSAVSLWVLQREQTSQFTRRIGQACAAFVVLTGMLTLSEYVLDLDFGLDQLLIKEPSGTVSTFHPGRMSPVTALNFVLVGCALLLLKTNRGILPGQCLAAGASILSLIALVGYAYGVESLYRINIYTSMALHTAVTFLVLCSGIFYVHPARGLMGVVTGENTGSVLARRLLPFAILVPLAGGWLRIKGQHESLYGAEFGVALFAVTLMLIFVSVIGWTAQSMSRSDEERKRIEELLRRAHDELEMRVQERTTALRLEEGRFHSAFDHAPIGMALMAPDGRWLRVNRSLCEIVGYSEADLLATDFQTLTHPDDLEADLSHARDLLAGTIQNYQMEKRYFHKRGHIVHILLAVSLVRDTEGQPLYFISQIEDISERKRMELAIAESRSHFQAVLDAATEISIIATNPHGIITMFNTGAERMLGYRADEMVGKQTPAVIHVEDEVTAYGQILTAQLGRPIEGFHVFVEQARQGIAEEREWTYVHKDGSRLPVSLVVTALRNMQGEVTGYLGIAKNISDRKRAEEAMHQQQVFLKERLKEANCLYAVSRLVADEQLTIDQFVQSVVALLPPAFQHPEAICARLRLGEDEFATPAYVETAQKRSAPIRVRGDEVGRVWVCYRADWPPVDGNPFLIEECHLIDTVAQLVGDMLTRKQAEVQLTHGRNLLKSFVEHTPAAVAMFDKNLRYVAVSKRWLQDYQLGDQDLIGRHHYDVFPEIRQSLDWQAIHQRCLAGAVERREEDCFVRENGDKDWLQWEVRPWRNETGEIGGIIMFTEVITRRKQMEESLREKEELFQTFLDFAPSAMFMKTIEGRYVLTNRYFEQVCQRERESIVGKTDEELFPREIADQYRANDRQVLEAQQAVEFEETSRNGNELDTNIVVKFPVRDRAGRIYATGGIATNITARKEMERKLEEAAFEWECQNIELVAVHKELVTMHEQALAATRAKSQFLASMSHEIRTPMNAIVAMAELLQETPLSKEQQEYVGRFSRAATSLLDLINDILDISKIEAGHLDLESIAFDIHDLVDKTAELMAVRAHAKQLELVAFVHPDVPTWVLGDPTRLRQVFVNLVGNAIKFTERGEVVIRVEPDEADPASLRCSVSDTGIGIPDDKVGSIFESFTQVDSSTTRRYGGTGLGLSISKRLVELMGGHIVVRSKEGQGSIFSFVVRLQKTSPPAIAPALPALNLQGVRLLVVDDNKTNRTIVREHLIRLGPVIIEAANGPEALAALDAAQQRGQLFDVAILDYQMPGMDGLELAQTIRERKDCPSLPLVMHASDMRGQPSQRARELSIAGFAYKPVSRMRLLESLSVVLRQTPAAPAPQTPVPSGRESEDLAPLRILLVEDLEDNRAIVRLFLKDTSHTIEEAENGLIALQKFQAGTYDLVFMDMQMPVMGGLEATIAVRAWEREHHRPPTPIIALTANAFKEELDKSLAAGCIAHLTKPIKKKTLLAAITQYAKAPSDLAA